MRALAPLLIVLLAAPHASAQALLKPTGQAAAPLVLKALRADTKLTGPVAVTTLTLRYSNPYPSRIEADFLYQLPDGAVATGFAYWYGDEKVVARIAEKKRAAAIYKAITTRQRDPALVELVGKNKLRARIFPVEPNADLRIELVYVTALPRERDGSALFTLPLTLSKEAPALASCAVTVSVAGWPQVQNNLGLALVENTLHYDVADLRPSKDLRVRVGGTANALVAAPSGGPDGFFALTSLQKTAPLPPQSFSVRRQPLGAGWLVTGRYHHATEQPDPNGAATKLWAAQRLQELGSGSRKEALALSLRHGIVCAHTSWIAIPIDERKRYESEQREAAIEAATERLASALQQHQPTQKLRQQLAKLCEGTNTTPGIRLSQWFWDPLNPLADRAVRGDAAARRKLYKEAARIGADTEFLLKQARQPVANEELHRTLAKLTPLFIAGKETTPEAQALRDRARKLVEETHQEQDNPLYFVDMEVTQPAITRLVTAQLDGKPEPSADRALLQRLAAFTGTSIETLVATTRIAIAQDRLGKAQEQLWQRVFQGDHDISQAQAEVRKQAHARQVANPEAEVQSTTEWALNILQSRALEALANNAPDARALEEQLGDLERSTGVHLKRNGKENATYSGLLQRLAALHYPLHRDYQAIARLEAGLQQVEKKLGITQRPPLPAVVLDDPEEDPIRAQLLAERRKPNPDPARLKSLAHQLRKLTERNTSPERAKTRVSLLLTDTELEQLELAPPSPRQQQALVALCAQSKALHARFGDPLLSLNAPQNAQLVIARFADGNIKPLAWNPAQRRWELRFDVPPHATPGSWDVQLVIVHADGHREERTFAVTVDMSAPTAQGSLTPLPDGRVRLDIQASPDSRRTTAFIDGSEPQELVPTGKPGAFFLLLTSAPQNLRVIVTDRAHNRTELTEFSTK